MFMSWIQPKSSLLRKKKFNVFKKDKLAFIKVKNLGYIKNTFKKIKKKLQTENICISKLYKDLSKLTSKEKTGKSKQNT